MPLTDAKIRSLKPRDRLFRVADEKGLCLEIPPEGQGSLRWRVRYRFAQKGRMLSVGIYPEVSLKQARQACDEIRQQLRNGIDPSTARKAIQAASAGLETFEVITREWHGRQMKAWSPDHADRVLRLMENDLFPWVGQRNLADIQPPELLAVLRRIEARGAIETAHRALQHCSAVFRYGIATGRAVRDPAVDLRGALTPYRMTHFPTITDPKAIGELLHDLDGYQGSFITRCALQLAPLVFVRPGELRQAEWREFDLDGQEWRIPGPKMKMRDEHLVPLSRQAVALLSELHPLTSSGRYLFPGLRTAERPMSENTINGALRRLGYDQTQFTGHGFRSMASTLLHEQGFPTDVIERQLAHAERNKVKAAYNRAEHLPERRRMMQHWSDYLDRLKQSTPVILIHRETNK